MSDDNEGRRDIPQYDAASLIQEELQARIDALMLEYCPDEMTPEQMENWKRHQRRATPEEHAAVEHALREQKAAGQATRADIAELDTRREGNSEAPPAPAAPAQSDTPACPRMTMAAREGRAIEEGCLLEMELSALRAKQSSEARAVAERCAEICERTETIFRGEIARAIRVYAATLAPQGGKEKP